jgi:hypothetical protein
MGSNFIVASFIPSLAFVISIVILFQPTSPNLIDLITDEKNPILYGSILLFISSGIIGFTLTSLNTFILKVFEGYILIWRIPFLKQREIKKAKRLLMKQYLIRMKITRLEKTQNVRFEKFIEGLKTKEYELKADYQYTFPNDRSQLLPTEFGNILKAAENYAGERYGIDAVPLFTRLIHVVPENFQKRIDQSLDQLSFLVNCAVLATIFGLISLIAGLTELSAPLLDSTPIDSRKTFVYFSSVCISLVVAKIFQRASLVNVSNYGELIRSVFDLFRFELLKQLKIDLPENSSLEKITWKKISDFITLGEKDGKSIELTYHHTDKTESSS